MRNGIFVVANRSQQFSIKDQMLILPVIAMMGYNMLEAESFAGSDFRADFFFFACGMLTGVFRDKMCSISEEITVQKQGVSD